VCEREKELTIMSTRGGKEGERRQKRERDVNKRISSRGVCVCDTKTQVAYSAQRCVCVRQGDPTKKYRAEVCVRTRERKGEGEGEGPKESM